MNVPLHTLEEGAQSGQRHPEHYRAIGDGPPRGYYAFVPPGSEGRVPLVLVHGISRNAAELVTRFHLLAERFHVPLIAPLFRKGDYGMYQQLLDLRSGARADDALFDILDDAAQRWLLQVDRFALFGFSGGGQFAHRFALFHADRLLACVPASSGWYTLPDSSVDWPVGLRGVPSEVRREALAKLPIHVVVGGRDTLSDGALRRSALIDGLQGTNRIERARRWHAAMQSSALGPLCSLTVLQGARHSFDSAHRRGLVPLVFSLLEEPAS